MALVAGCSERIEGRARSALKHGRLDAAAELAQRLSPERAAPLLEEVAARRAALAEVDAEVDALLAALRDQHPNRVRQQLRDLRARQEDPAAAERVARALSELPDLAYRAAASGTAGVGSPAPGSIGEEDARGEASRPDARSGSTSIPFEIRDSGLARDVAAALDEESETLDPERAARSHEARGELERAIEAWRSAAAGAPAGPVRDGHRERARRLEARVELYAELAAAARGGRLAARDLDVDAADAEGIVLRGATLRWRNLPVADLWSLAERVDLTPTAESGLLDIVLTTGDEDQRRRARERVRSALADGRIGLERAEALLSGQSRESAVRVAQASPEQLAEWSSELATADLAERDDALDRLLAEGGAAHAATALSSVWSNGLEALRGDETLARIEQLSALHRELEAARAAALELIFDQREYFYPYRVPECPPERARRYPAVQGRVRSLVGALRELWSHSEVVELPESFRRTVEELRWVRARASRVAGLERIDDQVPAWFWGLPRRESRLTLRTFAPSEEGRRALRRSAAIRDYNRRLWEWAGKLDDEFRRPRWSEQRQVQITNDYREMFGLTALAWNPLLQESARIHARYMARTGEFGHYQQDPELETPRARMLHVGYPLPGSENCTQGTPDPMAAHGDWIGSSGHHRNLLEARHTEMASALEATLWAQNFGRDGAFAEELDPWFD